MNNAAAIDRAFALIARLTNSATPARRMTRASDKLAALATRSPRARAFYWLALAISDHKHATLAAALRDSDKVVAIHVARRNRAIRLFARRHAQQL